MEIIENDCDSKLILKWKSDEFRKIESHHCVQCNTIELNEKLKDMVDNLVSRTKFEKNFVEEKKGVLALSNLPPQSNQHIYSGIMIGDLGVHTGVYWP